MVELKGCQLSEMEGKLQSHPRLMLTEHTFSSLKSCDLKIRM